MEEKDLLFFHKIGYKGSDVNEMYQYIDEEVSKNSKYLEIKKIICGEPKGSYRLFASKDFKLGDFLSNDVFLSKKINDIGFNYSKGDILDNLNLQDLIDFENRYCQTDKRNVFIYEIKNENYIIFKKLKKVKKYLKNMVLLIG
uniref:Uncharacterized protein n=1 Tax=viral metagenome TaxID=1070528 RepID=A0A6C0ADT6_9ZZZZ